MLQLYEKMMRHQFKQDKQGAQAYIKAAQHIKMHTYWQNRVDSELQHEAREFFKLMVNKCAAAAAEGQTAWKEFPSYEVWRFFYNDAHANGEEIDLPKLFEVPSK